MTRGRQKTPTGAAGNRQATTPARGSGARRPGRNDPCHCGSGRKYKHCHLTIDEQESSAQSPGQSLHDLDRRLVQDLAVFAKKRFGDAWWGFEEDFSDAESSAQLSLAWSVYHYRIDGATVLDRYLEERGRRLSSAERAWLSAQAASWLSVWEALAVEPGKSITLRDLLTGGERRVSELSGSRTLVARDAVLARVVDHEGISLLCGMHPHSLPPRETAEVVRLTRAGLRGRGAVKPERLRDDAVGRVLIRFWEQAAASLAARPLLPRELRNTDGDPFLLTTDHFDIAPGARSTVEARLAALPGVEPPEPGENPPAFVFTRAGNATHTHWQNTVLGHATVTEQALRVETNSIRRADALRAQIGAACGDRIRHRLREHADPLSEKASRGRRNTAPAVPPALPPAEAAEIVHEFLMRHYTEWLDSPIPALRGKTPREAVRTARGRAEVDVLLKEMENHEQQRPDGTPFDFSWLRRELGLDDPGK